LERFVASLRGGAVIVSHDRDFLDRTVHRVVELDTAYGAPRVHEYAGGVSEYERRKTLEGERHETDYESYAAKRRRIEEQGRQMRQWEERGYGQGRKKKKTKDVKKAYRAKLARLDEVEKPWTPWSLRLELEPQARSGEAAARLDAAVVERGAFRLG